MKRMLVVRRWTVALVLIGLGTSTSGQAQTSPTGERIREKLVQARLIDPYFPEVALEVGESLRQAAAPQWAGVQVIGVYRPGWVNI